MPVTLTPKQIVETAHDVLEAIDKDLIDATTGEWKAQPDLANDAAFIQAVETAYEAHMGPIDPKVKKVISAVIAGSMFF